MPKATIEGEISPEGYIHIKYNMQLVDDTSYPPYDIIITPKDEDGAVSFMLPQGINVTISLYKTMGGNIEMEKTVRMPRSERIALADLLQ